MFCRINQTKIKQYEFLVVDSITTFCSYVLEYIVNFEIIWQKK